MRRMGLMVYNLCMIVVHIPCDTNTRSYAEYAFAAMQKLARDPTQLRLQYHDVVYKFFGVAGPSSAHGAAVREAFKSIAESPSETHIICDSDTVVIQSGWDVTIHRLLDDVDCLGSTYPILNEHSRINAYQNKPTVTWLALKSGKPWHHFEPQPPFRGALHIDDESDSRLWGLPVGQVLHCDTCWNFPVFLFEHQLTSLALKNIASQPKALMGLKVAHDEWELPDGSSFVVHQGRSGGTRIREMNYSREFYERCDRLIQAGAAPESAAPNPTLLSERKPRS